MAETSGPRPQRFSISTVSAADYVIGTGLGIFAMLALFRLLYERYGYNDCWGNKAVIWR